MPGAGVKVAPSIWGPMADIVRYDSGFPAALAKKILVEYAASEEWRSSILVDGNVHAHIRDCAEIVFSDPRVVAGSLNRGILLEQARRQMSLLVRDYCARRGVTPPKRSEQIALIRYSPAGRYKAHFDDGGGLNRSVSCVVNLNNDFDGGGLAFPRHGVLFRAETGSVTIFPSSREYVHEVQQIMRGTRYVLVTWFS